MGLCGGPIFGARFCEQFGFIMTSTARTKRKKSDPKKLKLFVKQLVAVRRVCMCADVAKNNCLTLLNHCVEGVRGNLPTSDRITMWSISLILQQKLDREKTECKRATFGSANREDINSVS